MEGTNPENEQADSALAAFPSLAEGKVSPASGFFAQPDVRVDYYMRNESVPVDDLKGEQEIQAYPRQNIRVVAGNAQMRDQESLASLGPQQAAMETAEAGQTSK
eukprot:6396297-Amphidinium_carterae.1